MFQKKKNEPSLSEELPYWEFSLLPRPHLILNDGSLVAGIRLNLIDIECFDDGKVNQLAVGLRGVLNSISENTSVQFCLSVGSDFSEVIQKHSERKSPSIHPLIANIAEYRETRLREAQEYSELYRPELFIYFRTQAVGSKKLNFLKKQEAFSESATQNYDETLEVLFQNVDTLLSSFASVGLFGRPLGIDEIQTHIYRNLNPKRSQTEMTPKIVTPTNDNLEEETLDAMEWLAEQSPREQLVFGDLILGFEQFTLDSFHHRVVTLKTLPEVTFAGQISTFLRMPFHYDLILSFEVPSQADEISKFASMTKPLSAR